MRRARVRIADVKSGTCPCCGQFTRFRKVAVSLDFNTLSFGEKTIHLTPQLAEIAFVLAGRMPGICTLAVLAERAWGACFVDDVTMRVGISRLRRQIKSIGLSIETIRGIGWRLVLTPSDDHENAAELESAAAPEPAAVVPAVAAGSPSLRRAS